MYLHYSVCSSDWTLVPWLPPPFVMCFGELDLFISSISSLVSELLQLDYEICLSLISSRGKHFQGLAGEELVCD